MNNLFVMHTQYNLILAAGLVLQSPNDINDLVLYSEFKLNDEMLKSLERVFNRVIVVVDHFTAPQKLFREIEHIQNCLRRTQGLWEMEYERVYLSQERTFDLALYGKLRKNNRKLMCLAIEEDAYYSINNCMNNGDYIERITRKTKLANLIRRVALWKFPYNHKELIHCYGMSSVYYGVHLLFPQYARRELLGKELIEVTEDTLAEGIEAIYAERNIEYPEGSKYFLVFMDLMSRYNAKDKVKQILEEIVDNCSRCGRTVLLKYHPRETERLDASGGIHELDMTVPAEKVLLELKGKDVVVLGNATTACRVAAKLGYKVYSICRIDAPENEKMHEFMSKIGVRCITSSKEIENY